MTISETIKNHPALEGIEPEAILDTLWDHDLIGVSLVTPDGHWLNPSPELCRWLGYTQQQLEKLTWMDITIRADRKEDLAAVQAVLRGELASYTMFKTYIRRNETLMPSTLMVIPVRNQDQKVVMFISQIALDERYRLIPPLDELRIVFNFMGSNKKLLISGFILYTLAIGLAGEGSLRWLSSVLDAFTSFGGKGP